MTQYGPASAFLLVGGKNISGEETFTLKEKVGQKLTQSNGLGDSWDEHLPVGLGLIELEAGGGFYNDRTAGIIDALQAKGETRQVVAYGMAGHAVGADVVLLDGAFAAEFERIISKDDLTHAQAAYKVTGDYKRGVVVNGLTAKTADPWNTRLTPADQSLAPRLPSVAITSSSVANPSVITAPAHGLVTGDVVIITGHAGSTPAVDGERTVTVTGANTFTIPVNVTVGGTGGTFVKVTSTGAVLDLHVPELTLGGYTNFVGTPVHSADNVSYITLGVAFTAVTAAGASQRQTVAGAVQRFTALDGDFTGAGSGQSVVAFVGIAR